MKAVRIHEYGGPEKLVFENDVPEPSLSGDGVLIRVVAAGVNPIDWKMRSGARQKDFPLKLPAILGRDVSGIVEAVGSDVRNFKLGERVAALSSATYAELVVEKYSVLTHAPEDLELTEAAAIPLISLTGDQLIRDAAGVGKGQRVLVTGALGSVGRAAVHSALKLGAVVIAGVRQRQLDEAQSLGVAEVLAVDDADAIARLVEVDALADTVGGEVAAKLIAKVRNGGRVGYVSVLPEGTAEKNPRVKITRTFAHPDPSKVREFLDDRRDGKFSLPIGRRLPLSDAAEGHRLGEQGGVGKILLLAPKF